VQGIGTQTLVSVVVPVLDEQDSLPALRDRLAPVLASLGGRCETVFVDDGSTDGSVALIEEWCRSDESVVLVKLSRNFGMEVAMSAGLDYARGDYVVLMHADLQDPPELIPEMLEKAQAGADVVYARRIGRDESLLKRSLATAFYSMMERLARTPYQGQAGDFRLVSRRVVEAVRQMPERRRFLRGMIAFVGYEQVPIEYQRAGREAGRGATYPALFRLAAEALTAFSDVPLALATFAGIAAALVASVGGLLLAVLALVGVVSPNVSIWILTAVLLLGGMQLVSIGILGRYVARIHEQVLTRPLYLVDNVIGGTPPSPGRPVVERS
jgi:glycosyltransferase involved in cell wall biosynthesis